MRKQVAINSHGTMAHPVFTVDLVLAWNWRESMSSCLRKWHIETSHVSVHSNLNSLTLGSARKTPLRELSRSASDCQVNVTRPVLEWDFPKSDFQWWHLKALGLLQKSIRHFQTGLIPFSLTVHSQAKKALQTHTHFHQGTDPGNDRVWLLYAYGEVVSDSQGHLECVCVCVCAHVSEGKQVRLSERLAAPGAQGLGDIARMLMSPPRFHPTTPRLPLWLSAKRASDRSAHTHGRSLSHTHNDLFQKLAFSQVSGAHSQVVVIELNISWQKPLLL